MVHVESNITTHQNKKKLRTRRPITRLPTMYKILISTIPESTHNLLEKNNLLPAELNGYKKEIYVSKNQLTILEDVKTTRKKTYQ